MSGCLGLKQQPPFCWDLADLSPDFPPVTKARAQLRGGTQTFPITDGAELLRPLLITVKRKLR